MATIFRPTHKQTYRVRCTLRGARRDLSTQTADRAEAARRVAQWEALDQHELGRLVLDRLLAGQLGATTVATALGTSQAALHGVGAGVTVLRDLLHEAEDQTFDTLVPRWLASLARLSEKHRTQYEVRLLRWERAGFTRLSHCTPVAMQAFLDTLPMRPQSKWNYWHTMTRFLTWCHGQQVLRAVPAWPAPPRGKPRDQWLDRPDIDRLLTHTSAPLLRAAWALAYGGAVEASLLVTVRRRDLDPARRMVMLRGTKTSYRRREARIEPWAWPHVWAVAQSCLPEAALVPLAAGRLSKLHKQHLAAAGLPALRLHDARRSWAVRMLRAGVPMEAVSRQMGHGSAQMVLQVYGRFATSANDWDAYEARMDRAGAGVAPAVAPAVVPPEVTREAAWRNVAS